MPLEDLLETIETLRGRIQDHGPLLSQNEIRTRYALIDPLLRALGWDTENPSVVVPEQDASGGRADYALLRNGQPEVMVEAKKLGTALQGAVQQGVVYCMEKGTRYFAVTDGQHWAVYDTQKSGPLLERVIAKFDLGGSSAEASLKALTLWRPSVAEGNVREGATPVVAQQPAREPSAAESSPEWACPECEGTFPPDDTRRIAGHKQQHTLLHQPEPDPMAPSGDGEKSWIRLSDLHVQAHAKPEWLLPPSGVQVSAPSWTVLVAQLAQWLVDMGRLSEATAPIQIGKRYVLAQAPTHPDGKAFKRVQRAGPLYVETNYSAADTIRNARLIIKRAEMQPSDFRVRLAD